MVRLPLAKRWLFQTSHGPNVKIAISAAAPRCMSRRRQSILVVRSINGRTINTNKVDASARVADAKAMPVAIDSAQPQVR